MVQRYFEKPEIEPKSIESTCTIVAPSENFPFHSISEDNLEYVAEEFAFVLLLSQLFLPNQLFLFHNSLKYLFLLLRLLFFVLS